MPINSQILQQKTWNLLSHYTRAAYRGKLKSKRIHPQQLWNAINPLQNIYKTKLTTTKSSCKTETEGGEGWREKSRCMRPIVILNLIHAMLDNNSQHDLKWRNHRHSNGPGDFWQWAAGRAKMRTIVRRHFFNR